MKSQVLSLAEDAIIDTSLIGLDSTSIASNQADEKNYEFYSHRLYLRYSYIEIMTTAEVHDSAFALDILAETHHFLSVSE